uniref:CCZ1/INTU/HSP4 first Longin domain-containing protein n=1 Tax=Nomascus leucogenys TaxID=61853 RepID=A0A2I3H9K4_NOMLE
MAARSGPWAAQEKQFPPALLSFFIYNPCFRPREEEGENKILFHHPNKIRNVGLCEAIVQFTRTFTKIKIKLVAILKLKKKRFSHGYTTNWDREDSRTQIY